jgi:putative SOS response-associated peptidase YedK
MYRLIRPEEKGRNTEARYNIAPTQSVEFVIAGEDGNHTLKEGRWGLVPFWAKEVLKATTFNARSEEADAKPMFRNAWRTHRCLIPADGFYEWTKNAEDGGRDPWFIHLPDQQPFSFAGLWAHNDKLDITSCTILTTAADEPMKRLHDRQPVILDPAVYDEWLDPSAASDSLKPILKHDLDGKLQYHRVGRDVNTYKSQGETLTRPFVR